MRKTLGHHRIVHTPQITTPTHDPPRGCNFIYTYVHPPTGLDFTFLPWGSDLQTYLEATGFTNLSRRHGFTYLSMHTDSGLPLSPLNVHAPSRIYRKRLQSSLSTDSRRIHLRAVQALRGAGRRTRGRAEAGDQLRSSPSVALLSESSVEQIALRLQIATTVLRLAAVLSLHPASDEYPPAPKKSASASLASAIVLLLVPVELPKRPPSETPSISCPIMSDSDPDSVLRRTEEIARVQANIARLKTRYGLLSEVAVLRESRYLSSYHWRGGAYIPQLHTVIIHARMACPAPPERALRRVQPIHASERDGEVVLVPKLSYRDKSSASASEGLVFISGWQRQYMHVDEGVGSCSPPPPGCSAGSTGGALVFLCRMHMINVVFKG
ncbi:hypothetical protein C8R43DRAFT_1108493 [Mycena crocata]|nr:hypothetical protein C8R43DRAFT_1108493 [Mycena crocata]